MAQLPFDPIGKTLYGSLFPKHLVQNLETNYLIMLEGVLQYPHVFPNKREPTKIAADDDEGSKTESNFERKANESVSEQDCSFEIDISQELEVSLFVLCSRNAIEFLKEFKADDRWNQLKDIMKKNNPNFRNIISRNNEIIVQMLKTDTKYVTLNINKGLETHTSIELVQKQTILFDQYLTFMIKKHDMPKDHLTSKSPLPTFRPTNQSTPKTKHLTTTLFPGRVKIPVNYLGFSEARKIIDKSEFMKPIIQTADLKCKPISRQKAKILLIEPFENPFLLLETKEPSNFYHAVTRLANPQQDMNTELYAQLVESVISASKCFILANWSSSLEDSKLREYPLLGIRNLNVKQKYAEQFRLLHAGEIEKLAISMILEVAIYVVFECFDGESGIIEYLHPALKGRTLPHFLIFQSGNGDTAASYISTYASMFRIDLLDGQRVVDYTSSEIATAILSTQLFSHAKFNFEKVFLRKGDIIIAPQISNRNITVSSISNLLVFGKTNMFFNIELTDVSPVPGLPELGQN
jgi:hypothetical protein